MQLQVFLICVFIVLLDFLQLFYVIREFPFQITPHPY